MQDSMLTELYMRVFAEKKTTERLTGEKGTDNDILRAVAIAKNKLLCDLIAIRTDQIRFNGE